MNLLSVWELSLTGGVLVAAVLLIRAAAGRRLPRAALPVLWGVALCRLLLPLRLPSPTSVYAAAGRLEQLRPGLLLGGPERAAQAVQETGAGGSPLPVLTLVWAGAALGIALCVLIPHLRCMARCRASLPEESPLVGAWMAAHPLRRPVRVRCSDRIDAPFTCGVLRPVIYLPRDLDRTDGDRLAFVLAHELAHIRRWDALTKWLLAACLCIHWFNPLVWAMYLLAVRDLELACDEAVLRICGPAARADYARTLVALEEKRARFAPMCSSFAKNALEERILAIMKHKKWTAAGIAAAAVLAVALIAVFATNPPGETRSPQVLSAPDPGFSALRQSGEPQTAVAEGQGRLVTEDSRLWELDSGAPAYTQADYDLVYGCLMVAGWEELPIASFNRTIHAAFNNGETGTGEWNERLYTAYERVLYSLPQDDPIAPYLLNTVQASQNEYQARLEEVYTNKRVDPAFSGRAQKTEEADVYGDTVHTAYVSADYRFTYRILDQEGLTVAARDQFLQAVMRGGQGYLDNTSMGQLIDSEDAKEGFRAALEAAGLAASSEDIEFTGCTVEQFEGYYGQF